MRERKIKQLSDTEAVIENFGPTSRNFSHVHRPALRTQDDWVTCCEKETLDEIRNNCQQYRRWH